MTEIKRVAVIGAGMMGHGIAQVFAMKGYEVNLLDISNEIFPIIEYYGCLIWIFFSCIF